MNIRFLLASLTLALFLSSPAHADITLGLAAPLTGENAFMGEQMKHGVEQAVADINAAGGINGEKISLHSADDGCEPKQAVTVANQMASQGIKFVVGHGCSGTSIPASKVYNEEGILMITPASSNPLLTEAGFTTIFRTYGRDDKQGAFIADYMLKHFSDKKIAIVHDKSAWGSGITAEIQKDIHQAGKKEVLFDTYTPSERDYSPLITKMKQAGVEVAFIGGYFSEVGLIVRQMKEQKANIQVVGGDAMLTNQFWSITGDYGKGVLMSACADPRHMTDAKAALDAIRKNGFEPDGYTLYAYAAVQVLAEAIKRTGKNDPAKAAASLRQTPVKTIVGVLEFDAKGDVVHPSFSMNRWHDGAYSPVEE